MYAHQSSFEDGIPWWRQASLTGFAVIATSHLSQVRPQGPFLAAALCAFMLYHVRAIMEEDPAADRNGLVLRALTWTALGPLFAAVLPAITLSRLRLAAALVFLQCEAGGQLGEAWIGGQSAVRIAALFVAMELVLVWGYCVWAL
jgi:hypothetical protein